MKYQVFSHQQAGSDTQLYNSHYWNFRKLTENYLMDEEQLGLVKCSQGQSEANLDREKF